jgi:hypothetical protein
MAAFFRIKLERVLLIFVLDLLEGDHLNFRQTGR